MSHSSRTPLRADHALVTFGDDPIPWDMAEGGEVRQWEGIAPLVLTRWRTDASVPYLVQHSGRTGRPCTVRLEHLSRDGDPTGAGLEYEGTLTSVTPARYDANSDRPMVDTITIKPKLVRGLPRCA